MNDVEDKPKRGLGKGLSALFSENDADDKFSDVDKEKKNNDHSYLDEESNNDMVIKNIKISDIKPSQFQPRFHFDEETLKELSESIKTNGVLQPILVRPAKEINGYEIIAGERRWRASKLAGLTEIPAIVKKMFDVESAEIALIENIQRNALTPIEEADGYKLLLEKFGYTQNKLSEAIGKSRSHISNLIRLLNLPEEVKKLVDQSKLSMGHARCLLQSKYPMQHAKVVIEKDLSVRETENLVSEAKKIGSIKQLNKKVAKDNDIITLEKMLSDRFGSSVKIKSKSKEKGAIMINYDNLQHLDAILSMIGDR